MLDLTTSNTTHRLADIHYQNYSALLKAALDTLMIDSPFAECFEC